MYLRVLSGNVPSLVSSCSPPLPGAPSYPLEGIHIVPIPHPDVTHHLTPTYTLTPAIATSLISAVTLVKPDWLNTLLASGRSDEAGELSLLEELFVLPQTTKFRPSFSPSLPPQLKKYGVWEPNEERSALFRGHRFVFVGEKGAETQNAMKELVKRGEGDYECFAAASGKDAFRQVLAKGRARKATLVPVATRDSVTAAVGRDGWLSLVQEATRYVCAWVPIPGTLIEERSFELKFIVPEKIVEAVIHADISLIDATHNPDEGNMLTIDLCTCSNIYMPCGSTRGFPTARRCSQHVRRRTLCRRQQHGRSASPHPRRSSAGT